MKVTAIFGGTFNPFHIGHYEMLKALQNDSNVEEIFLMPDRIPPHKACDFLAEDSVRIEMCRIAAKDFSKAKLCLIEFEREGKSYSYDTVLELKARYPQKNFAFVCGGDMLVTFNRWYKYKELIKEIAVIAFRRSDTDNDLFDKSAKLLTEEGMRLTVKDEIIPAVSSTEVRQSFKTAQKLLPLPIFKFLAERGVYSE